MANVRSLPYPLRMRELALHARRLAGTPELAALLNELAGRGDYERRTALHMAMAARDLAHIAAVLAGPDMGLRRAALRAVRTLPVPDEAAEAVLDDAPTALRHAFYRTLRHGRRHALADRLLPQVRERWGDREAATLLPACSGPVVAASLPGLAHAVVGWRTLGKRHPEAVLDAAEPELRLHSWRWWRRRGAGIEAAAPYAPGRVLSMLETSHRSVSIGSATWAVLMRADPARTGPLLMGVVRRYNPALLPIIRAYLRTGPLDEIISKGSTSWYTLTSLMEVLPPGRREAVYDGMLERGKPVRLQILGILHLLSPARAAAEARSLLEWHGSTWHSSRSGLNDPDLPLKLQAFLPYAEASEALREAALSGDARRRALARGLWVECASRTGDRALLVEVVSELALRSVNEQDPVRAALLGTLRARLRPALLDDAFAEPLGRLAIAAIESRDSSPGTRRTLRSLAARVLRHAEGPALTEWATDVYVRLMARYGADGLAPPETVPDRRIARRRREPVTDDHRLDRVLRRGTEHGLLERVRPHLEAARRRGDFSLAVTLARSLGRRAYGLPYLQDTLRSAIHHAPDALAGEAAHLWLADRRTREERAVELVRADAGSIVHPRVWSVIAGRRTDLLATLGSGDVPPDWAPVVTAGMAGRWTPDQRERLRRRLVAIAGDTSRSVGSRLVAVGSLGRLPGTLADLADWAGRADSVLAEPALAALSFSGDPSEALRLLLAHGRGLASPTAVAAMGRCCTTVPPSRLGPLLEGALNGPNSKVTVRKQAARLLERHRPPGAADVLFQAWLDPDLHRDARVAVATALRHMPEIPGALEALDDATGRYAGEVMLRTLFQADPWDYAPEHRPRYASLVRRLLNAAQGPGVRFRGDRAFGTWVHWYEAGTGEIIAAVADPADRAGAADLPLFLSLLRAGNVHEEVAEVVGRLLSAGRDAEARRRVTRIVRDLPGHRPSDRRRRLAARLAALLTEHPLYVGEAMRLEVNLLLVDDDDGGAGDLTGGLLSMAGRLRDRPLLAVRVSTRDLPRRLKVNGTCRVPPAGLLPAARRLLDEGHLAAELMALALVQAAGPAAFWTRDWRTILDRLRDSGHLDVAAEAWELEPES